MQLTDYENQRPPDHSHDGFFSVLLIEVMRYSLEAARPSITDLDENRKANFRANAEASIEIVDAQGQSYTATRVGNGTAARLVDSDGQPTGLAVSRRFNLRVFGQRELQEFAQNPAVLREFVASTSHAEWDAIAKNEKSKRNTLDEVNTELSRVEKGIARLEKLETDLADHKEKLTQAKKVGAEKLLKEGEKLNALGVKVRTAINWPSRIAESVVQLKALLPAPSPPVHQGIPVPITTELKSLEQQLRTAIDTLESALAASRTQLAAPHKKWEEYFVAESNRITAALAAVGISNAEDLARLQKAVAELEDELSGLPAERETRDSFLAKRVRLLDDLSEIARSKSRIVEAAATRLNEMLSSRVRLVVEPLADQEKVAQHLRKCLRGSGVSSQQVEKLAQNTATLLAGAIRSGASALQELGCTPATATKVVSAYTPQDIRRLEELDSADRITGEVNVGTPAGPTWRPLKDVSPGQRATAVLALVLLSGADPLVIDQPEDDLDNRYIFDEVVTVLRDVCQSRQVIVATHNANIPVLGDAELVIALDADSSNARIEAIGGFENPAVAATARHVLEGGEEAFRTRQRRYLRQDEG